MKIEVQLLGESFCELDADIDNEEAIEQGEGISEDEFQKLFAVSIIQSIGLQIKENESAKNLYNAIYAVIQMKWQEFVTINKDKETQEEYNKFFGDRIISDVKFIPKL